MYLQKWRRTTISNSLPNFKQWPCGRLLWSPCAPHLHMSRMGGGTLGLSLLGFARGWRAAWGQKPGPGEYFWCARAKGSCNSRKRGTPSRALPFCSARFVRNDFILKQNTFPAPFQHGWLAWAWKHGGGEAVWGPFPPQQGLFVWLYCFASPFQAGILQPLALFGLYSRVKC